MFFQDFALLPWRTVEGNISLALEDHPIGRKMRSEIIDGVLARTNLTEFRKAYPRQLSGGMKQRVAIARALSVNPAVMLMDEPLSALDSQIREILMADLIELWCRENFTAFYVTHNLAEAVSPWTPGRRSFPAARKDKRDHRNRDAAGSTVGRQSRAGPTSTTSMGNASRRSSRGRSGACQCLMQPSR